jgi:hypothetical protein
MKGILSRVIREFGRIEQGMTKVVNRLTWEIFAIQIDPENNTTKSNIT